jgi:hypothetical protein
MIGSDEMLGSKGRVKAKIMAGEREVVDSDEEISS